MKILLDNCVPMRLRRLLAEHEVSHASEIGWGDVRNGDLLSRAAARFDVFLTVDQNLRFQQRIDALPLAVLELNTRDTRFKALKSFTPHLPAALALTQRFCFVSLRVDGTTETFSPRTI